MPKAAKEASRVIRGGYGARRTSGDQTSTGRERSAPRWNTASAIAFTKCLLHTRIHDKEHKATTIARILVSTQIRNEAFASAVMARVPPEVCENAESIINDHRAKVQKRPSREQNAFAKKRANLIRARLLTHTGPCLESQRTEQHRSSQEAKPSGWWLDQTSCQKVPPRAKPAAASKRVMEIKSWGLGRLGVIPRHAIICYNRAKGRVDEWRRNHGKGAHAKPPIELARALVHTNIIPTTVAQPGDHWYLIAANRWVTPTEGLRIFGVRPEASLTKTIIEGRTNLSAQNILSALGKAVKIDTCREALKMTDLAELHGPLRYGSAFSGIDLFAAAVEEQYPNMQYLHAAESSPSAASALAEIYKDRGLTAARCHADARAHRDLVHDRAAQKGEVKKLTPALRQALEFRKQTIPGLPAITHQVREEDGKKPLLIWTDAMYDSRQGRGRVRGDRPRSGQPRRSYQQGTHISRGRAHAKGGERSVQTRQEAVRRPARDSVGDGPVLYPATNMHEARDPALDRQHIGTGRPSERLREGSRYG